MKRFITLFLATCMLLSLVACSNGKEDETDDVGNMTVAVTEDAEKVYLENLPERDYDGYEFMLLCTTQTENFYNIDTDTMNDSGINKSVYERNIMVEDKYGVEFVYDSLSGNRNDQKAFASRVTNSAMAGAEGYDLVVAQCYYMLPLAASGILADLNTSEYLHWDMPWYSSDINDNGIINGKLYGASGSYVMSQISYAMAMFYNKQFYANEKFEEGDIYELVRNKQWTFEVFNKMSKNYYTDVDNSQDKNDGDIFGYVYNWHGIEASVVGSDVPIVEFDADGMPTIDNYYNERTIEVFNAYFDYYNYSKGVYGGVNIYGDSKPTEVLGGGKALFASAQLGMMVDCAQLRGSEYDYGVVPMPLFDEEQENYLTYTMRWELFYIPTNVDFERSAIVLEYLNYTTDKVVVPEYWNEALSTQQANTEEDSEMLALIKDRLYYDFTSFYGMEMGGIYRDPAGNGGIITLIEQGNSKLSSWWNSNVDTFRTSLDSVIENYG